STSFRGNAAEILWRTAAGSPDRPAIVDGDAVVSYATLRGRAAAVAQALRDAGVTRGDRVVVFLDRGVDAAACYFGGWAAGAVVVMVNDSVRTRQLDHILSHSGARVLVTSDETMRRLHRPVETPVTVLRVEEVSRHARVEPLSCEPVDLAQITYTSGSTGLPKGVVASHGNVWAAIATVAEYLGLHSGDRIASALPFSSVYGANQLLCAVLVGA